MATAEIEILVTDKKGQLKSAGKTMNELTATSISLNREIKTLTVGSEKWLQKTEEYKRVNKRLKDIKSEVYETGKAQQLLNSSMGDMLPFNDKIARLTGTYSNVTAALKGTTLGTNLLTKAMIAIPIVGLITAITSLVSWFASTQRGMDAITSVTRPLIAIWDRLMGLGQDLALNLFGKIRGWLKDPMSAFSDFGTFLQDQIINRLKALGLYAPAIFKIMKGEFSEGIKDLINAHGQLITGVEKPLDKVSNGWNKFKGSMEEAVKVGSRIDELTKNIEKAEVNLIKRQAELALIYKESSEIAENVMASEKDRQAAAQRAIDATEERIKLEREFMDMKIEKMKLEHSLNDTSRADELELARLEAERLNFETAASEARTTARSKLNVALQAQATQAKKAHEEAMKQAKEREKAEKEAADRILEAEKKLQEQRIAVMSDDQERKIAEINLNAEREIAAFEGTDAQKTEFLKLKQQERDAAIQAIIHENKKKAAEEDLARLQEEATKEEEIINQQFYNKLISEEERNEMLYELQKAAIEKRLALMVASGNTETAEYQKLYTQLAKLHYDHEKEKTDTTEKYQKARADMERQALEVAGDVFGGMADLLSADEESKRKNFAVIKALKMAELKVSFINELAGIWENANKNPLNAVFPGAAQALAVVKSIAATARFGAGMVQVASTKFADGGVVKGPSHQQGGIPFTVRGKGGFEMEGDEIILTKGVYRNPVLRAIASDLNGMAGGRRFALGGPVIDRGFVPTQPSIPVATPSTAQPVDLQRSEALLERIATNTEKMANNPTPISIQKIRDGLNTLSHVENEARF